MPNKKVSEFGKWRSFFWPIHRYELKKVIPMFLMCFLIDFIYSLLKNTKDALLITAPGSGVETIPFLKVGGIVPAAAILMLLYIKLSNLLSKPKLFYITVLQFILFFLFFRFFLYPSKDFLQSSAFADYCEQILPAGFSGLIAIFRHWVYALFYIFAELWGSFILTLLFWGFANDITKLTEAKRFYSLFGFGANLGLLIAGPVIKVLTQLPQNFSNSDPWETPLNYVVFMVVVVGFCIMFIYHWIQKNVLTDPRFYDSQEEQKKRVISMSLFESLKILFSSKKLFYISILVLSYNIAINIVEITWKGQLNLLYPENMQYLRMMGIYSSTAAIVSMIMMFFVSNNVLKRFGWAKTAGITPSVLFISGIGFLGYVFFQDHFSGFLIALGQNPLVIGVIFGMIQNVLSKASKYSLFDPTKEMSYISLELEFKTKGKAVIDTVGSRFGKAVGAGIQLILITLFGSLSAITLQIAVILCCITGIWFWSIRKLDRLIFHGLEKK